MADKLRIATGQGQRRRLANDLAFRNDLLANRSQEYVTAMIKHTNPYSNYLFFTGLFGDTEAVDNQRNDKGMFTMETSTTGAEFIRIREDIFERRPWYVVDSSKVPITLVAGEPFEVGIKDAILDEGEQVQLYDQKTMLTVVSRRATAGGVVDVTFLLNGQPGDTADGSLLSTGMPINYGFGNTKGEGSSTSNTLPMDSNKRNIFSNPTVITRYMWKETGSAMSDEVFKFSLERGMDGSEPLNFAVNIPVEAFKKATEAVERLVMDSVGNFDIVTLEPTNQTGMNGYPALPTYAGIYQQLDQAHVQYKVPAKSSHLAKLQKIESIQTQIQEIWPDADIMIVAQHGGLQWVRDGLLLGGQQKYNVQLTQEVAENRLINVGYGINKFSNNDGNIYIHNMGKGYRTNGEFAKFTLGGKSGPVRSRDIWFIPVRADNDGMVKMKAKYFTKSGKGNGHQQVDRGFVFGRSLGITGEGNGRTGEEIRGAQEATVEAMMRNPMNDLGSIVDGNEYHMLFEGVPYIDIYGVIKVSLID